MLISWTAEVTEVDTITELCYLGAKQETGLANVYTLWSCAQSGDTPLGISPNIYRALEIVLQY